MTALDRTPRASRSFWRPLAASALAAACTRQPDTLSGDLSPKESLAHSPERPWRDTSALIAVRSYSYWDDARSYEASREQLTAEQLALLDGLRAFAKPPSRVIAEDLTSHEVQIRDQDGTVAVYGASPTTPHLDGATLAPCLATFNCLSLFDTLRPFDPGVDGALPDAGVMADPAEAPLVSTTDVGCLHAVPSCGEVRLRLAAVGMAGAALYWGLIALRRPPALADLLRLLGIAPAAELGRSAS